MSDSNCSQWWDKEREEKLEQREALTRGAAQLAHQAERYANG